MRKYNFNIDKKLFINNNNDQIFMKFYNVELWSQITKLKKEIVSYEQELDDLYNFKGKYSAMSPEFKLSFNIICKHNMSDWSESNFVPQECCNFQTLKFKLENDFLENARHTDSYLDIQNKLQFKINSLNTELFDCNIKYYEHAAALRNYIANIRESIDKKLEKKKDKAEKRYWIAITVSCPDDMSIDNMTSKTIAAYSKKWIDQSDKFEYQYEQRGNDEITKGSGKHIHMLVKTVLWKPEFHIKREFASTFGIKKQFIYVDRIISDDQLNKTRKYMNGDKKTPDKLAKVEIDKIWRKENNLPEYKCD